MIPLLNEVICWNARQSPTADRTDRPTAGIS